MSTDASSLPNDVIACHALIAEQFSTIDDLQHKLAQLKNYVAQLVRARFGPRSERLDPNQLTLFVAAAVEVPPLALDVEKTAVKSHTRRGGGRNELPAELPRQRIEHDLAEQEKLCPGCGELRQRIGCETSEQLEFIPAQLKVLEHVRWKYACRHCQEHVVIAQAPAKPIDKGLPGPGLLAQVAVGKFSDHLPLYRLEDVFARGGVELSRSTLCRWARCTSQLLEPLYQLMVQRVRRSHVIHTDDTPVRVLDPMLPKTRTGRFWVYCGDPQNPYSVYDYTVSRKRDGPANFLKDYQGYLQADAFAGYDGIYAAGTVKQVLCWAHARRKFFEAKEAQPHEANPALAFIARLQTESRVEGLANKTEKKLVGRALSGYRTGSGLMALRRFSLHQRGSD